MCVCRFDLAETSSDSGREDRDPLSTLEKELGPEPGRKGGRRISKSSARTRRAKKRIDAEMKRLGEERFYFLRRIELDKRKLTETQERAAKLKKQIAIHHKDLARFNRE